MTSTCDRGGESGLGRWERRGLVAFAEHIAWWPILNVCSSVCVYAGKHGELAWMLGWTRAAMPGIGTKSCVRSRIAGEEAIVEDLHNKGGSYARQWDW